MDRCGVFGIPNGQAWPIGPAWARRSLPPAGVLRPTRSNHERLRWHYRGTGYSTDPGLPCATNIGLSPMTVAGGHVEFGNISGWVQPNGQLRTVFGQIYMYGQFQGTHFEGLIQNPQPACNYRLVMDRTG